MSIVDGRYRSRPAPSKKKQKRKPNAPAYLQFKSTSFCLAKLYEMKNYETVFVSSRLSGLKLKNENDRKFAEKKRVIIIIIIGKTKMGSNNMSEKGQFTS